MSVLRLALAYSCSLCAGFAVPWSMQVTPDGRPSINIKLEQCAWSGGILELGVSHRLIFNGVTYESRLVLTGFESYLVPASDETNYIWRDLNGNRTVVRLGTGTSEDPREGGVAHTVHEAVLRNRNSFDFFFRAGRLVQIQSASGDRLVYERRGQGALEIRDARDNKALLLCRAAPKKFTLITARTRYDVTLDENGRLLDIKSKGSVLLTASYHPNGLLDRIQAGTLSARYIWMPLSVSSPRLLQQPPPPVVFSDSEAEYSYSYINDSLEVSRRQFSDGKTVQWRIALGSHSANATGRGFEKETDASAPP